MTGNKLTIGLIGAGRMGTRWAKIISEHQSTKLSAVIDVDEIRGRELAKTYGVPYFSNVKEAIASANPDAFTVVTPHKYLAPNSIEVLKAGKHVFVEKPGAHDVKEIKKVLDLVHKKKLTALVGFNYRFFDGIARAHEMLESGKIGKLLTLRLRHGHAGRTGYEKEWRMNKSIAGGGVLMDQGVHLIDLVRWFAGDIKSGTGILSNEFLKTPVEDNAVLSIKTKKGVIASVTIGITEWQPIFFLEAIGDRGSLVVNGVGRKYGGKETVTLTERTKNGELKTETFDCNSDPDFSLHSELEEFVTAIRKKRQPHPNVNDAYETLRFIHKIYGKK